MLKNKATSFAKAGDHTLARFTQMFSPVFVPREDVATAAAAPMPASAELAPANETAVSRLKRRLPWGVHHDEDDWLLLQACHDYPETNDGDEGGWYNNPFDFTKNVSVELAWY